MGVGGGGGWRGGGLEGTPERATRNLTLHVNFISKLASTIFFSNS